MKIASQQPQNWETTAPQLRLKRLLPIDETSRRSTVKANRRDLIAFINLIRFYFNCVNAVSNGITDLHRWIYSVEEKLFQDFRANEVDKLVRG